MILTKLMSKYPTHFEYVNLEHISYVDADADGSHYSLYLTNGVVVEIDITDPVITAMLVV